MSLTGQSESFSDTVNSFKDYQEDEAFRGNDSSAPTDFSAKIFMHFNHAVIALPLTDDDVLSEFLKIESSSRMGQEDNVDESVKILKKKTKCNLLKEFQLCLDKYSLFASPKCASRNAEYAARVEISKFLTLLTRSFFQAKNTNTIFSVKNDHLVSLLPYIND